MVNGEAKANRAMVVVHWGAQPPDWILALAERCDSDSQAAAARSLGVSGAMINQALHNSYLGKFDRLEQRVRGEFMNATVECPVLGKISTRECLDVQARPFANTNPQRVAVFKACRAGCPNFRRPS